MLKEGLPESKLHLDSATKGEDAISLMDNGKYDACLVDLHLEKNNGRDCYQYYDVPASPK